MRYLIACDISESRCLQRVQRHMQQYACALQRSVYLYEGNEADFQRCLAGLRERINPSQDDVRIYGIGALNQLRMASSNLNPEGVWLSG